jgi:cell division protein FtsQ
MILCGFAHQWKQYLSVEKIEVEGNYILSTQEIINLSKIPIGMEIFQVSLDTVSMYIKKNYYVKDVYVTRVLPDIIHIQLIERQPIASLMLERLYYLDNEGIILPKISTDVILDLPIVTGIDIDTRKITPGTKIPEGEIYCALRLLETAMKMNTEFYDLISEINLNYGDEIMIYSSDYGIPINFGREGYDKKIMLLYTFWKQVVSKRGADNLKSIDVRFDDQVVVVWKNEANINLDTKI